MYLIMRNKFFFFFFFCAFVEKCYYQLFCQLSVYFFRCCSFIFILLLIVVCACIRSADSQAVVKWARAHTHTPDSPQYFQGRFYKDDLRLKREYICWRYRTIWHAQSSCLGMLRRKTIIKAKRYQWREYLPTCPKMCAENCLKMYSAHNIHWYEMNLRDSKARKK